MNSFEIKENVVKFLLPQTKLFHPIDKYGCNFRSLQASAEIHERRELEENEIEDLFSMASSMSWVDKDCYVNKPEEIVNSVFKLYKTNTRAWNCGVYRNGQAVNWKGHQTDFDFCIIKLWQPDMKNKHFVLGDKDFKLVFDPYPNSASAKVWNVKDIYLYSFFEV